LACVSVVLVLALAITAPEEALVPAPVNPRTYELEWNAPAGCPDADSIRKRISSLIATDRQGEGILFVRGVIEQTASGFSLALQTDFLEHRSTRRIEGTRCSDLGEATALVIATALEPGLNASHGPKSESIPEPATASQPQPQPKPKPERKQKPERGPTLARQPNTAVVGGGFGDEASVPQRNRAPSHFTLRSGLHLEYGSLPAIGGGIDLAGVLNWDRLRLELRGAYLWPRTADGPANTAGRFQLGAVGTALCGRLWAGRVEFPLCAGLEAGAMRVDSRGALPANTIHNLWLAPLVGAGVAVAGQRFGFWSLLETGITAVGSRTFIGDELVFASFPASFRVKVGFEILFAIKKS
jgi:hypothetical protein